MPDIRGFYVVAQTPFTEGGALDEGSIDSLCAFYIAHGVDGFTALGISGEAGRLTQEETLRVSRRYVARAEGRPVILGVSNPSIAQLADTAARVMDMGAAGVMVAPHGTRTEADLAAYFAEVARRLGPTPIVLQDFPAASGAHMSVAAMARLIADHPTIAAIKHEDAPSLPKLTRLLGALPRPVPILTGSNALYLPEELRRGAAGPMAGFSFPEVLAGILRHHRAGEDDAADDLFATFLPLIRHEAQGVWGLAIRKEVMRRRGAIASAAMRAPAPRLDAADMAELDRLLRRLARRTGVVPASLAA